MSTELKVYKEQTIIKLFDWNVVITTRSLDDVLQALNGNTQFIKVWWKIVNIRNVAWAEVQSTNDIDIFILNQTDPEIRDRLRDIVDTRTKMGHKTNWVKHLVDIYNDRYAKIFWAL